MGEKNKPTNGFVILAFLLYNFFFMQESRSDFSAFHQESRLYNRERHFPKTSAFLFQIQTGSPNKFHCCVSPPLLLRSRKVSFYIPDVCLPLDSPVWVVCCVQNPSKPLRRNEIMAFSATLRVSHVRRPFPPLTSFLGKRQLHSIVERLRNFDGVTICGFYL